MELLAQLKTTLDPSNVKEATISPKHGIIALLNELSTELIQLCPTSVTVRTWQHMDVKSYVWGGDHTHPSLCASSPQGNIAIYRIPAQLKSEPQTITELHRLTLKSLLGSRLKGLSIEELQILCSEASKVALLIDKQLILQVIVNETKPWEVQYTIDCPQKLTDVSVTGNMICLVDNDQQSILFYDRIDGSLLSVINRIPERSWSACRMSSDYLLLYLLESCGDIYCCNLDVYFSTNKALLNQSKFGDGKKTAQPSKHWFEKLGFSSPVQSTEHAFTSANSAAIFKVEVHGHPLNFNVIDKYLNALVVNQEAVSIVCVNITTMETTQQLLKATDIAVLSPSTTIPHIIISGTSIMSYAGLHYKVKDKTRSPYDHLITTNEWGELQPTMGSLADAISTRNMDQVTQYLQSQAGILDDILKGLSTMENLRQMCELISSGVQTYGKHSTTQPFSSQLASCTLNHLQELSRRGVAMLNAMLMSEDVTRRPILEKFLEIVTDQKMIFKDYNQKFSSSYSSPHTPTKAQLTQVQKSMPSLTKEVMKKWNQLSNEEVVGDGILMNDIALLQAYFRLQGRESEASWDYLVKVGLDCVLTELEYENWSSACQMLKNMGFGVFAKLSKICLFTTNKTLRKYLVSELQSHGHFSQSESEMVQFADLLEELYPCHMFSIAAQNFSGAGKTPLSSVMPELQKYCGEITNVGSDSEATQSKHYIHYMLNWLSSWMSYKHEIILERVLGDEARLAELESIPPETTWNYLCRHNRADLLIEWVKVQMDGEPGSLPFHHHEITDRMMEDLNLTPSSTRCKLLDHFARHGRQQPTEQSDDNLLYRRLARLYQLFPVSENQPLVGPEELVCYLVKQGLVETLYFLLDISGNVDKRSLNSHLSGRDLLLVEMIKSFNNLSKSPDDAGLMVEASLSSNRYLSRHPYLTLSDLLDSKINDDVLCTLMYLQPFHETSRLKVPKDKLSRLTGHPMLKQLLTKPSENEPSEPITIYSLLRKWGKMNYDRLLAWQRENNVPGGYLEDLWIANREGMLEEMPHFSSPVLAKNYGQTHSLDYVYYLLHARPSYAFSVFLATELIGSSSISPTRISLAVKQAHFLAIKHYKKPEIVASCIAFVEMLGETSSTVKLHYNATNAIRQYFDVIKPSRNKQQQESEIETLMMPLVFGKKTTLKVVVDHLERSTLLENQSRNYSSTGMEALWSWRLVVDFCKLYELPLTTVFLEECSKENDWVAFLTFSQIYQYSSIQLHGLLMEFKDESIKEHLQCVIENIITKSEHIEEVDIYKQDVRHGRTSLLANLHALKRRDQAQSLISSSEDERHLKRSKESPDSLDCQQAIQSKQLQRSDKPLSSGHIPDDIFAIMFLSDSHKNPWRMLNAYSVIIKNPVLAVLSACHQESLKEECLLFWLLSQTSLPGMTELVDMDSGKPHSRHTLIRAINGVIQLDTVYLFRTGLKILLPDCPLIELLDCYSYLEQHSFLAAAKKLTDFKDIMHKSTSLVQPTLYPTSPTRYKLRARSVSCKSVDSEGFTLPEVTELAWAVILRLISSLECFLVDKFLHLLDNSNLIWVFSEQGANFTKACKLYKVVYEERLEEVKVAALLTPSDEFNEQTQMMITKLMQKSAYDKARAVCRVCGVDVDNVSVYELERDLLQVSHQPGWLSVEIHTTFWKLTNQKCTDLDLAPTLASDFFKKQSELTNSKQEKVYLNDLALFWLRQDSTALESGSLSALQKLVWQSHIDVIVHELNSKDSSCLESKVDRPQILSIDKTQFLTSAVTHSRLPEYKQSQEPNKEQKAVEILIWRNLEACRIQEACHVAVEYKAYNQDLSIVLACIELANHLVTKHQLDPTLKSLLEQERKTPVSRFKSNSLLRSIPSSGNLLMMKTPESRVEDEILETLKGFESLIEHGSLACQKVTICYQISLELNVPYREIILQSEFSLLKSLLANKAENRYILAQKYIETSVLSECDVSSFLASTVTHTLKRACNIDDGFEADAMTAHTDIASTSKELRPLIQLFSNAAEFGASLLESASSLLPEEPNLKQKLAVQVELLVLSHDSYSSSYDMEGISNVLKACRRCALMITEVADYPLMVQLLTGIGRFSEMTYIFDILKQNHQFELLFRKGIAKENKLRLAVLDYLRRFCPGDNDTYRVVSSHFAMYREIAQLLQETADKQLTRLKFSDVTAGMLADIQKNYTDSAEIYIEGECLKHAQKCVRKARLLALQTQLLPLNIQVINLEPQQVKQFLINHDRFHEVYIVSEAYHKSEWVAAVCTNTLAKGNYKYLEDYRKTFQLNNTFFSDVLHRFSHSSDVIPKSHQSLSNIHRLLLSCTDVVHRYRLAQEMGVRELEKDLLSGDPVAAAYIRDTCNVTTAV